MIVEHATKALVIDDITRIKLHREADQDVLDLIREMMIKMRHGPGVGACRPRHSGGP
ncbi:hypothetical protein ACWD3Z_13325 [Streptomyces sp. NPDC002740]